MTAETNHFSGCRLCTLYSGSDGNSTYISGGGTSILIDAGKSARALTNALKTIGALPKTGKATKPPVDAIFITHEHTDHIAALLVLSKQYRIPIHVTEPSAEKLYKIAGDTPMRDLITVHPPLFSVEIGTMTVSSFPTSHDSRMSVGYRICLRCTDGSTCDLGYATDLGTVTPAVREGLQGCRAVVLESNHDPDMLLDGPYPFDLKMRIRSRYGHLSNSDAAALAASLAAGGTTHFLLAHLSKENNIPEFAYAETHAAIADERVTVRVASPSDVTFLIGEADNTSIPQQEEASTC